MASTPKAPNAMDKHVGSRIRFRRLLVGMSQEKLGEALGVTFQQVQKYEKGTNRIGGGRLHQIAETLGVPVSFFYEGTAEGRKAEPTEDPARAALLEFMATREGVELMQVFLAIPETRVRRAAIAFLRELGPAPEGEEPNPQGGADTLKR